MPYISAKKQKTLVPFVSVVIPIKNAAKWLEKLIEQLLKQKTTFNFDVIFIDSGSKDDSLKILTKFAPRIHQIKPEEFNHGETRNLALKLTSAPYIAFLTQDALPASEAWLASIIEPFKKYQNLAGVFGLHKPYPDANPLIARDIISHFKLLYGEKEKIQSLPKKDEKIEDIEKKRFFSNVNSCVKREIFEKIPFQKINYCEDQLWAEEVLKKGYATCFSLDAAVYHSHSFPFLEAFRRYYDEYLGLHDAFKIKLNDNLIKVFFRAGKISLLDIKYLWIESGLNMFKKFYYSLYSPIFNLARQFASYLAYYNKDKIDRWEKSFSREKMIKKI